MSDISTLFYLPLHCYLLLKLHFVVYGKWIVINPFPQTTNLVAWKLKWNWMFSNSMTLGTWSVLQVKCVKLHFCGILRCIYWFAEEKMILMYPSSWYQQPKKLSENKILLGSFIFFFKSFPFLFPYTWSFLCWNKALKFPVIKNT